MNIDFEVSNKCWQLSEFIITEFVNNEDGLKNAKINP